MIPVSSILRLPCVAELRPVLFVDAVVAKRNLGHAHRRRSGRRRPRAGVRRPGRDAHAVIETKRGHTLGRVIYEGEALRRHRRSRGTSAATPRSACCALPAPASSAAPARSVIGWVATRSSVDVGDVPVSARSWTGCCAACCVSGLEVTAGFKLGDVDPRG